MDDDGLPDGMERVGYDADTQQYTFRSENGALYHSTPGSRHGELIPMGFSESPEESEQRTKAMQRDKRESMRIMLPFVLLVLVVLLMLFKLIDGGGWLTWEDDHNQSHGEQHPICAPGLHRVEIGKGDTCWSIAEKHGVSVEELLNLTGNGKINCDRLGIGQGICVLGVR